MENASFVGEVRTGATSDSPARNGIRRSASPKSARARAHHSDFGSPDSSRVHKPIDLCGSSGRIPSTLGLLRISGRHRLYCVKQNLTSHGVTSHGVTKPTTPNYPVMSHYRT